jgi:integrase
METKTAPGRLAKKSGRYYAVLFFIGKDGRHIEKWIALGIPTKGNKAEAERMLLELRQGVASGEFFLDENGKLIGTPKKEKKLARPVERGLQKIRDSSKTPFGQFMKDWLEHEKTNIEATTYTGYHKCIYVNIAPYFDQKGIYVENLTPSDLDAFYKTCLEKPMNPNTVIKFHANIRKALQWALRSGLVLTNVADAVEKPKKRQFQAKFYNLDQMKTLLEKVKGNQLEFAVLMACHYGLRREEIVGLKWDAIDMQYGKVEIKHVVTDAIINGHYQQVSEDRAKTKKSLRTLPLFPSVKEALLEMRMRQDDYKHSYGAKYNKSFDGYVYLWPDGHRVKPMWVTSAFHNFLKANGLPLIRFHDLRHSCATLLREEGVPMEDIQKWLGHSTITTTEGIYAHFDENGHIGTANKVADAFGEDDIAKDPKEEAVAK